MRNVRANTSMYSLTFRVRVTTPPAVWTKWNGVVADNVTHAARASILSLVRGVFAGMCSVCGVRWAWRIPMGSATHFWCCHSNATRAPIANQPNSAQLGIISYYSAKLHPGPCNSVGMRPRTYTHTHTNTQTDRRVRPQYISRRLRLTRNVIK